MKINKVRPGWVAATAIFGMATLALGSSPALAKSSGGVHGNKLQCFDGTSDGGGFHGVCTLTASGATLNNNDGDDNPNNNYSGVYLDSSNLGGKRLSDVNQLAFSYTASALAGGSPRISLPIDTSGDGGWDDFAFIDALGCDDGAGTVDVINDPSCLIWLGGVSYANWSTFAAANPTYRIANDTVAFVIADQPGTYTISNVRLGRGPAKSR